MMTQLSAQHRHLNDLKARLPVRSAQMLQIAAGSPQKRVNTLRLTVDVFHVAPVDAKPVKSSTIQLLNS